MEVLLKVRCIENRFALRMVGPETFSYVQTDTPNPSLAVGKVYDAIDMGGEFAHVFDESYEGAVWPMEYFEWVEDEPQQAPAGRVIPFRRENSS